MTQDRWTAVDSFFHEKLIGEDDALDHALASGRKAGMPEIHVSAAFGALIHLLARTRGAERILEIGTLAGYSTIWLARALPAGGKLISLELDAEHARVARQNVSHAGLIDRVDIRIGEATESLAEMAGAGADPFDFIFIDADKRSNPAYLEGSLRLSGPGTLIVVDNVVRNGAVAGPDSGDPDMVGIRTMIDQVAANPRLTATAIQTVGGKGYDGFAVIRVD